MSIDYGGMGRGLKSEGTSARRRSCLLLEEDKRNNLPGHALPSDSGQQRVESGGESRWVELFHIQAFTQSQSSGQSMVVHH